MAKIAQVRTLAFNNEEIGMGFDSTTGTAVGTPFQGVAPKKNPVASGMQVNSSISIVTTHEELQTKLDMAFQAEGRYGVVSAATKVKFSEETNYNSQSTFIVARVVAANALIRADPNSMKLTDHAAELLKTKQIDVFRKAFGDSFVRGLHTGGEFYGVIRITSVSSSKQSSLAASLQAEMNGLAAAGSFKANFDTANKEESTKSEYTATMFQLSGNGAQASPVVEIPELIARYKAFAQIAEQNPGGYKTEVATYDTVPLDMPTPEEADAYLQALFDARSKKLLYLQRKNDLDFALRYPEFFESVPPATDLQNAISTYITLINAVTTHAVRLSRGEFDVPQLFDPAKLQPPLQEPAIVLKRIDREPADLIIPQEFLGCQTWADCVVLAAAHHLQVKQRKTYNKDVTFKVTRTAPPVNSKTTASAPVDIYTEGNGPDFFREWQLMQSMKDVTRHVLATEAIRVPRP